MEFIDCKASESSLRLYRHNLKKLNGGVEPTNYNFLKKFDFVMKLMPENKNTQRTAIISAVNACKGRKGFGKALKFYTDKMDELNNFLRDATSKTDRYKENEMEWSEIIKIRDKLPPHSIEHVLLCLYTMIPPRRALDMVLKIGKPQENSNWYDGVNLYFGNYKTKGTYNTQVIPVPSDLKKVIDGYLETRPFKSDNLLIKKSGVPFKTRDIQLMLNKILNKNVSVTMLRSIYLSSKYGEIMEEMKDDATSMGTSTNVIQTNYVKH
jgi:hypothetical protein